MFLFLSKLLPLFLYPLGLSCVLLVTTLILWWKRPAWIPFPVTLALIILLVASNGWISNQLVQSLEWQNIPSEIPQAEAIVLLGGATKPPAYPRPMVDMSEQGDRVLYAAKLYLDQKAPLIIASGGRIDWLSNEQSESADMANLLQLMGVPPQVIIQEPDSLNTYENATNVKKILQEKGIKQVLLVTSALHMPRSLFIFKKLGIDVIAAPTDFLVSRTELEPNNLTLEGIILNILPSSENLDRTTKALKEYIGLLVYSFIK
ncbi:protein of unknown function DUF218 [Gloeothece citriformis PCC 7424]|uniref:DUF218 domain-containing protein n=1 Tax=Gloeothece citriformis (strain PCC 7424) TaxID=65393 RepID=B7KD98_GLOC7|nr:YdcF family protein [Gloeothece citriformis]ACK68918.1 protein of unknown function DUF218 [Gloeothece citriformis PCC 7424]